MFRSLRIWRHFDILLLAAVSLMTIAGIAMIRSAIAGNESLAETVPRQSIYAGLGFVILLVLAMIDYHFWSAITRPMFLVILGLLALIMILGQTSFGSTRWFQVGIIPIQPSELSKIVMILVLADFFSRNMQHINKPITMIRSLVLVGLPVLFIYLQPDLSTSIVLIVIWLALYWAAGISFKQIGILVLLLLIVILIISPFMLNYFLVGYPKEDNFLIFEYYQMQRIYNFLFPDPEARHGSIYNIEQSMIAIGSGGLFGQGYGHGTQVQLRFLKVRHTDFIFSALAEEFGFLGASFLILLFFFIIYRCFRAARLAKDSFGALVSYGVAFLLLFQGSFNIGMNLNLFPVSGLPLPFFSYGGSSLVTSLMGIGLVESVIIRQKDIEF
ncbi:MAG: rod shape-determining protein RodA [Anaerolineales bacterium]|nr:rod shape-determining protein RodA [Anaerolineales bacterium]